MKFTEAINHLIEAGHFAGRDIWHNGNQADTYADLIVLDDETQTLITPTEVELTTAYQAYLGSESIILAEETDRTQVFDALKAIATILNEVDADITILNGIPTNAQLKEILKNTTVRQRKVLRALYYLVKVQ